MLVQGTLFLLVDQDVKGSQLLLQQHLPAHMLSAKLIDKAFETISKPQLNAFYYKVALVMVPLHSKRTVTKTEILYFIFYKILK